MDGSAAHHRRLAPSSSVSPAVTALVVDERDRDRLGVAIPRAEIHLVARFGASTQGGLDVHVLGARKRAHRKLLPRAQRAVTARLQLGAARAVLGVSAAAVAGRIVTLEELWGSAATRRLLERLAAARDPGDAALVLESAIAERLTASRGGGDGERLALDAAGRLKHASVSAVAVELGVSERHLRRVFREIVGLSPKEFARLTRFQRALRAARRDERANWASIATFAGYYDQAHLIAEFRAIAGATPRAFLGELRAALTVG